VSTLVSVIIPAFQEAATIFDTVRAVTAALGSYPGVAAEIIVVDDGSADQTGARAAEAGARVVRLPRNQGKGPALVAGLNEAHGALLLLLDADTGESADGVIPLLGPTLSGEADMTVGVLSTPAGHKGGFGLVKALARWGLQRAGAAPMRAPLSGQRVLTRSAWEQIGRLDGGFGIEMGLNLDAAHHRLRVLEVPVEMQHRLTGRSWAGFRHRGRQLRDVALAIARRPRKRP
jgi:glycosyltransferase involved in cell wall biosynthesis